jgi:hypothetical protein
MTLRASLLAPERVKRARLLSAINMLGRVMPKNGQFLLPLESGALVSKAREQTGLDDFGEDALIHRLEILLESFRVDAHLNFIGRIVVYNDILRVLRNRLRLVDDRKRHPEIGDQVIRRPLFISGLPRTGSTLLHALLAQDRTTRVPMVWEVMHPSPPPETATYDSDPRISETEKELKWLDVLMPNFKRVHLIGARLPQECIAILAHSFMSYVFESMYFVSSYRIWHDGQDKVPAYEFHRQFLQHLQWRCPRARWVLKAPSHILALEALFQVYPDAGMILTHRDPPKVLASCASFSEVLRSPFTDCLDRNELGAEVAQRWEKGARLAIQFRENNVGLRERFFDVACADLVKQPMAVVRQIYDHFDMVLTDEAQRAMRNFLTQHPQNKHGVHGYSLEKYGLDGETERRRFRFYTDYFGTVFEI